MNTRPLPEIALPCPFCGTTNEDGWQGYYVNDTDGYAGCDNCHAAGPCVPIEQARASWNSRPNLLAARPATSTQVRNAALEIERKVIDWIAGEKNGMGLAVLEEIISRHMSAAVPKPIDAILHCPDCGHQHIDAPEPENGWINPPHRKHLCHYCGHIWLAANVPTNGVLIVEPAAPHSEGEKP